MYAYGKKILKVVTYSAYSFLILIQRQRQSNTEMVQGYSREEKDYGKIFGMVFFQDLGVY